MSQIAELAERVERLLLRHDEIKRENLLLEAQLSAVTQERDSLRSRLSAARNRIDALIARLPVEAPSSSASATAPASLPAPTVVSEADGRGTP